MPIAVFVRETIYVWLWYDRSRGLFAPVEGPWVGEFGKEVDHVLGSYESCNGEVKMDWNTAGSNAYTD